MSFFKTLQHLPATITIFHNARIPTLARVYARLERAHEQLIGKEPFVIDLMARQMPTYDQFKYIRNKCGVSTDGHKALALCYPLMSDQYQLHNDRRSTMKSVGEPTEHGYSLLSAADYENLHKAFLSQVSEKEPEIDPSLLFKAPLVVDWDQNLLAVDEEGLDRMLERYVGDESLTTA